MSLVSDTITCSAAEALEGQAVGLEGTVVTEVEWLAAIDPNVMLRHFGSDVNYRKLRLFECACFRRVWCELPDPRSRRAVEVSEGFADGLTTAAELKAAEDEAIAVWHEAGRPQLPEVPGKRDGRYWQDFRYPFTAIASGIAAPSSEWDICSPDLPHACILHVIPDQQAEVLVQCDLLRCVFGNPFRPVAVDLSWWTSTVMALATGIYEERAFDRLLILADALQDAGCEDAELLAHCRAPGSHVRGCWVVDLVLGMV